MRKLILFAILLVLGTSSYAQVGVGTTTPSDYAVLDLTSTEKGFLPPRMTTAEIAALKTQLDNSGTALEHGMLVYNTDESHLEMWDGVTWQIYKANDGYYWSSYLTLFTPTITANPGVKLDGDSTEFGSNGFVGVVDDYIAIYNGAVDRNFHVSASVSYRRAVASTGNKTFEFYLAKRSGGTYSEVPGTRMRSTIELGVDGDSQIVNIHAVLPMTANDAIRVYVEGDGEFIVVDNIMLNIW